MRERNQLHGASGQATAINTERHINDGKVTTYPIKKEGTPKLHPYLPAIGNTEAGVFSSRFACYSPIPFTTVSFCQNGFGAVLFDFSEGVVGSSRR